MDMVIILIVLAFAMIVVLLPIGVIVIFLGTKNKTKWGINTKTVACPQCNEAFPPTRKPKNRKQALWGGFTCSECDIDVDKWGREQS